MDREKKHLTGRCLVGWMIAFFIAIPAMVDGGRRGLSQAARASLPSHLLNPKSVELISAEQLRQLLHHYRGRVILLNFWATWCVPCLKEFPDLSKLQEAYRDRGLTIIAVSVDEPDELETKVRPYVRDRAPSFSVYLRKETDLDGFVGVVDEGFEGILPTTYLIDRTGEVRKKLVGRKTYEEFEAIITPLLR